MLLQDHVFVLDNRFGGPLFDCPRPAFGAPFNNMTLDPHSISRSQLVMEAEVASLPRSQLLCHSQQQVDVQSYFSQHEGQHRTCDSREPSQAQPLPTGNLVDSGRHENAVVSDEHQINMVLPNTNAAVKRSHDLLIPENLPSSYEHHREQLCKRRRMMAVPMQHFV